MASTTSRLLLLLSLLQTRRDWPGHVLADRLETSPRTVRRDVDRLRGMGYRIGSVRGQGGGYRLDAGAELPPLLFDDEQAIALVVALRAASVTGVGPASGLAVGSGGAGGRGGSGDSGGAGGRGGTSDSGGAGGSGPSIGEAALRALTTVRQVLPARLRHRVDALQFTSMPPLSAPDAETFSPEILIALSAAIRARELIRFDYAPRSAPPAPPAAPPAASPAASAGAPPGTPRTVPLPASPAAALPAPSTGTEPPAPRRVEPHHLVLSAGRWYLVAWDPGAADWRIFRADRITPRTPTGPRFTPREIPGGDVHAFVAARFRGAPSTGGAITVAWPCTGTVILKLPERAVRPFAADGLVEPLDADRTSLTAGSWSWIALAASFARFDAPFEVVGPPPLADATAALSKRLAAAAGD